MGTDDDKQLLDMQGVQEVQPVAMSSKEQYPNPCGGFADLGNFRDVWWAFAWGAVMVCLVLLGGINFQNGNVFMFSSGDATIAVTSPSYPAGATVNITTDGECDLATIMGMSVYIAARCDSDSLFIGGLNYDGDYDLLGNTQCDMYLSTYTDLKNNPGTLKIPLKNLTLPATFPLPDNKYFTNLTLIHNTCSVDKLFVTRRSAELFSLAISLTFVIGVVQLLMMRAFPKAMVIGSGVIFATACVGMAVLGGIEGQIFVAVIFGIMALVILLFLCFAMKRIEFAAACLRMSATVITRYWGTVVVSVVMLAVQFAICLSFLFAIGNNDNQFHPVFLAYLLVTFWGLETVANCVHVTAAGATSHWFFALGGPATPPDFQGTSEGALVTLSAMKRTMWSLGSICFGSLLVAIIRTIRFILRVMMRNSNALVRCFILCILNCIEDLMRYFNDYAFVQVAMYGKPYITAAKDTWELIKTGTAWDAIINDSLVNWVHVASLIEGGAVVGVVMYFASGKSITWLVVGILVSMFLLNTMLRLIQSGVMTVFIGFWHLRSVGVQWAVGDCEGFDEQVGAVHGRLSEKCPVAGTAVQVAE
eukprot:TRINITY_DN667_c0_g1_i2.p1 TRINITY_DN667_c0_g1~~TRINITY_DN667_c0_g1_i2.p1  ORF type:complete len:589 (+),score=233.03 TRINITY_DN667_c0_g1_i2:509-2275(+)